MLEKNINHPQSELIANCQILGRSNPRNMQIQQSSRFNCVALLTLECVHLTVGCTDPYLREKCDVGGQASEGLAPTAQQTNHNTPSKSGGHPAGKRCCELARGLPA